MLKFAVLGEQCSGKTTAAEVIKGYFFNPQVVKFADPIYWALAALGQPKNRGFMQEFGDLAKRYFGERIFANLFMQRVTEEGRFVDALICDDVRRGYELDACLDLGFKVLYVDAPRWMRERRAAEQGLEFRPDHNSETEVSGLMTRANRVRSQCFVKRCFLSVRLVHG